MPQNRFLCLRYKYEVRKFAYFSRNKGVPESKRNLCKYDIKRTLSELILIQPTNITHRLLHDIPRFLIISFFIFNQWLSIRAVGRRDMCVVNALSSHCQSRKKIHTCIDFELSIQ